MIYVEWDGSSSEVRVECQPFHNNLQRLRHLRRLGVARFGEDLDGRKYWFVRKDNFREFSALFQGEFVSDPKPHIILGEPEPPPPDYLKHLDTSQPPRIALPLYPFQVIGASYLEWAVKEGLPVILADMRGLGKSPQALGAKERLWASGFLEEGRPTLDITLASLKIQTVRDGYGKFLPHRKAAAAVGTKRQRMKVYDQAHQLDAVVINYELLLHDWEILKKIGFQFVWCDEPHLKIASPRGKMHQALVDLGIPAGFATTGSPIRKNPVNLYGLLRAIKPSYMEDPDVFEDKYLQYRWNGEYPELVGYRNLDEFVRRTEHLVLRRTPEDAGFYPPELRISSRYVELTTLQEKLEARARAERSELADRRREAQIAGEKAEFISMLEGREKLLTWVRHAIADDPLALMASKSAWVRENFGDLVSAHIRRYNPTVRELPDDAIIKHIHAGKIRWENPKLAMLVQVIEEEILPGKVIIFTGLKTVARTVYRKVAKYGAAYYVGGMKEVERDRQLQRFIHDPNIHVLICTDAGGVGLNVQAAQFGINYNMPSDFTVIDQRMGRNNRLGSTFTENIWINLVAQGSIDEQVMRGQKRGEQLSNFIVAADQTTQAKLRELAQHRTG